MTPLAAQIGQLNIGRRVYRHLLLVSFVLVSVLFTQVTAAVTNTSVATVDFVKGYVTVFPQNDRTVAVFAKRGMSIGEKDFIKTGDDGFISLSISTGTVVTIQPLSEVSMDVLDCASTGAHCNIVLDALTGTINSSVKKSGNSTSQFTITTPYAIAAVRGTVFDIDVVDDRLLAGVTEGQVNVTAESGAVELPENFGTQVRKNQAPSEPVPLLDAPNFIPGPKRFETGGLVAWEKVPKAEQYLFSFDNASGLAYQSQSADTQHSLLPLELGAYAMRIRAIDEAGLKGQVAQKEFDVVKTNKSRKGPNVLAAIKPDDFSVQVLQQATGENQIELNFSATKDFEKLSNLDVAPGEIVSADRATNSIYVRARGILSDTEVTLFGPVLEIPGT